MTQEQAVEENSLAFLEGVISAGDANVGKIKLLVYGPPGTGKTSLGATLPQPSLHLLSESHGDMSVKRVEPNADILKIKSYTHLIKVVDGLAFEEHPYKSVCMDSLTDMQQMVLRNMKGGSIGAKVTLQEWGVLIEKTKDLARRFRDLDMHVCVITLDAEVQDDMNRIIHTPALAGKKLPKELAAYFNLVGFQMKVRSPEDLKSRYITLLDAGDTVVTKTHPALDPEEDPNVTTWIGKINEYGQKTGEGVMSDEVKTQERPVDPEDQALAEAENIIGSPDVKALFDQLGASYGKRIAAARKYETREAVMEALQKLIEKKDEKEDEKKDDKKDEK